MRMKEQTTQIKLTKEEELGENQDVHVRYKRGEFCPIHTHDYFELEFLTFGKAVHYLNSKQYEIGKGSVLFLTPADCHRVDFDGEATLWNISFAETAISEKMRKRVYDVSQYHRIVDEETLQKLEESAALLMKETQTTGFVQPLLEYILSLILPEGASEQITPIKNALYFAQTRFRDNPTLAQAARLACLSPVYFGHLFKKTYGVSFCEYVNSQKAECAKILLSSGLSVSQTCFEAGFNSLSNFLRVFKAATGISPKEYQKRNCDKKCFEKNERDKGRQ